MKNFERFLNFAIENKIGIDEERIFEKENLIKIEMNEIIANTSVTFNFIFDKDDNYVDISCNNFLGINEDSYVEAVTLVNTLNTELRGVTFFIEDGNISVKNSILVNKELDEAVVMISATIIRDTINNLLNKVGE